MKTKDNEQKQARQMDDDLESLLVTGYSVAENQTQGEQKAITCISESI